MFGQLYSALATSIAVLNSSQCDPVLSYKCETILLFFILKKFISRNYDLVSRNYDLCKS